MKPSSMRLSGGHARGGVDIITRMDDLLEWSKMDRLMTAEDVEALAVGGAILGGG